MSAPAAYDLWWKNAVIYCVDVELYADSDGDGVDPRLGTLGDLVEFLRAARERGIRVIADLVVNHTSDEHPWFQSARAEERSPWRDFYVWADEQPKGRRGWCSRTPRTPTGTTTRSPGSGSCTASTGTCLTSTSPTRESVRRSARSSGYWLELGLSGFRVDAARS
jgi:glycosidase